MWNDSWRCALQLFLNSPCFLFIAVILPRLALDLSHDRASVCLIAKPMFIIWKCMHTHRSSGKKKEKRLIGTRRGTEKWFATLIDTKDNRRENNCVFTLKELEKTLGALFWMDVYTSQPIRPAELWWSDGERDDESNGCMTDEFLHSVGGPRMNLCYFIIT